MNRMNRWKKAVDHLVEDLIGDGDVSHLPGAGRPLQLGDDKHTPAELRAAHKIMQDHDVVPDWMTFGKSLEEMEHKLRLQISERGGALHQSISTAARSSVKTS